jgi:hypothetical protein
MKHREQVDAGLIPKDSPPDFVRPEGDASDSGTGCPRTNAPRGSVNRSVSSSSISSNPDAAMTTKAVPNFR